MEKNTAASVLEINLDALRDNVRFLRSRVGRGCDVAAVVKANAYGIGMAEVAGIHRELGTGLYFVATLDEGIALRRNMGQGPMIAILGGLFHGAEDEYAAYALIPVLNSLGDISRWQTGGPAILHIDTGMRRLGLDRDETARLRENPDLVAGLNLVAVISHFACADEPGHPLTAEQSALFRSLLPFFPDVRKSICNSAGIFECPGDHYDFVRPGMAVYGLNPLGSRPNPMKPVVSLRARVLQVRAVRAGETVGYAASYSSPKSGRVATIALGYADGFLRSISNRGQVFWNGKPLPILGRVSMDLVTIDASGAPDLEAGCWVEVMGPHQDADALAAVAGTIGYEILTDLGSRYARVYTKTAKTFEHRTVSG